MTGADRPTDAPLRGIALICFAGFSFVIMNTFVKYLAPDYPVPEIIWARYFFHLVLIMVFFPRRIPTLLVSTRKGLQILRSVLVLLATACTFTALRYMALADVFAISFVTPLLVTALSVPMLHEAVGRRRWFAVLAGFAGVLIIIRPGAGVMDWVAVLPLAMAFFYALYQILTRLITTAADPLTSLFYTALVGTVATTLVVPYYWRTPTPEAWAMLVGAGFFGGIGHFALIRAYERAAVSVVAPFGYVELIWATTAGLIVFGDFPDLWTFVGAGVITLSGLYVLHRERRRPAVSEGGPDIPGPS